MNHRDLTAAVARLAPVDLAELDRVARLADRADLKYLVEPTLAVDLVEAFADRLRALEIRGGRTFSYRSTYLDTAELRTFLDAAHRRRRRFKTRIRAYPGDGSFFEMKRRASRRRTVKRRVAHPDDPANISDVGAALIADAVGDPTIVARLVPTLVTTYDRITLLDPIESARITIDLGLSCHDVRGGIAELEGLVIVESKSMHRRLDVDRWLWRRGARPVRFSKYATGLAVLRPELPRHRWNRTASLLTVTRATAS